MSLFGGRAGGGGGHHCIRGCDSRSTKVCLRKGHIGWCILCGSGVKPFYGCDSCKVKDPKYFTDKNPHADVLPKHEAAALERQQKREAKEKENKQNKRKSGMNWK
ncbi:hypothetical protein H2200_008875 [Cladophialophora chaetospira]|uniref:Uncharacterized protein n=1 Tax=Cladophialophora chaetospira TaxID=386627 RepID=A0AA39CG39_9EURO|nr:hypothetical protein H2200_008875 [Cladophialophora chaetospira]